MLPINPKINVLIFDWRLFFCLWFADIYLHLAFKTAVLVLEHLHWVSAALGVRQLYNQSDHLEGWFRCFGPVMDLNH